jgi:glycosyltransferase involved in cell wall biosynthesis
VSSETHPVRIAFCITDLDPGGAERALVQLVTRLDREQWDPTVLCLAGPGLLADELQSAGVPVVCLGAKHWSSVGIMLSLVRALRQFRPAILQTFLFHANILGRIAGRLAGIKTIVSGIRVAEKRSRLPLWIDRWTNGLVEVNVCVSQAVADFSANQTRLLPGKIVVIPNGVDVARFAGVGPADLVELGIPGSAQVLLTIGRLDRQKGLSTLIEAAALVVPRFPHAHFLLVGEGPLRSELERMVREKELADHIHLAGWRSDVPAILATGTALILPSLWEGMPNVVLEAMASGLPVVATRVEGSTELVTENRTGHLVPVQSPSDLAAAIENFLSDPTQARLMGQAGQERAKAQFSWDKMVGRYCELYRALLARQDE